MANPSFFKLTVRIPFKEFFISLVFTYICADESNIMCCIIVMSRMCIRNLNKIFSMLGRMKNSANTHTHTHTHTRLAPKLARKNSSSKQVFLYPLLSDSFLFFYNIKALFTQRHLKSFVKSALLLDVYMVKPPFLRLPMSSSIQNIAAASHYRNVWLNSLNPHLCENRKHFIIHPTMPIQ